MCLFCAAIPAALAVGLKAEAQQRQQEKQAQLRGEEPGSPRLPVKVLTVAAVAGLGLASITYHSQLSG
jgi:hypothetical protein